MVQLGLQLYTVRDHLEQDFEGTLRKVAELGYQGVEFAGFYGRTAEQVQQILQETGLVALGSHTQYARLKNALAEEIAFNKAIGNHYLVFPYLAEEERDRWDEVIEDLKVIGKRCAEEGMILCYHNHDFEITQKLQGKPVLDVIYEKVPANLLKVELDSCWVSFGGADPLEYIVTYRDRLPLLHLKDMVTRADGSPETVELGRGEIAVDKIADSAIAADVKWLIVEQDYCAGDSLESISVSMDWLRAYSKKRGTLNV